MNRPGGNQRCQPQLSTLASTLHTKYMGPYEIHGAATRAPGARQPYKTYGPQISHTLCMGRWGGLRAPIRNTWASDLSYILYGDFSHIFCMGISLIHFVWGFLQLLVLRRDSFNSVDLAGTRNMSQGVNLLYLFRYQIGGGMAVLIKSWFCQYISLSMKYTV